ncbi:MAG: hypothetical protein SNJ52_00500 [Verrucomicrobiia bacterium]
MKPPKTTKIYRNTTRRWTLLLAAALCTAGALQAQIISEQFDYPANDPLPGANGGIGFGGAWAQESVFPGGILFYSIADSLTYPGVAEVGNRLSFFGGNGASPSDPPVAFFEKVNRPFASTIGPGTYTFYYLFEVATPADLFYSDFQLLGTESNLRLHFQKFVVSDDPTELLVEDNATNLFLNAGTNLIYGQLTLNGVGNNDSLSIWMNPDITNPGTPGYTLSSFDYGLLTGIELTAQSFDTISSGAISYDAITIIPEPPIHGLLIGGMVFLLALIRRRLA